MRIRAITRDRRILLVLAGFLLAATVATAVVVDTVSRPLEDDRYTLLVMGSDLGPWRPSSVLQGRSDALHLVSVVPSQRSVAILSFPRDTYVPVPGFGNTRINAALTAGPDTAVTTVENVVGVDIDHWIVTGMSAFVAGVDDFGGIDVNVPQQLRLDDTVLQAGEQRLSGLQTLIYTRDRKSRSDGDFGRNQAQAEVLATLHAALVARDPSPTELLKVIGDLRRSTVSNIPPALMPQLAALALDIEPGNVVRRQVPGTNANRGGAAVVVPTSGAEALYADLRDDGLFSQ